MGRSLRITAAWFARAALLGALVSLSSPAVQCEEGMWVPQELLDQVLAEMRLKGLELAKREIWNDSGTGIANAVVRIGATGSFVSPRGLILTNHHVAFGAVQRMSTPEQNYIENGFLARSLDEEVPAYGYLAYVPQSVEDVTGKILSAVNPSMSPLERFNAIERRTKEIVREEEESGDFHCEVSAFYGGAKYLLYRYLRIKDVRVVYVPARAIGEYGGDTDNWMWPRHCGDFSFLRAYVAPDGKPAPYSEENVPYEPKSYLKVAPEGLEDGDFAMIIGFPGRTNRYLTSYGLAYYQNFAYPERIRLFGEMIRILDEQSKKDPLAAVRVAATIKGLNNVLKNNEGMLEGFKRFKLLERQQAAESKFRADLEQQPELRRDYAGLLDEFKSLYEQRSRYALKDLVMESMLGWRSLLGQAMTLYKWSLEKEKEDMDRDPGFMDRRIPDLKRRLRFFQMSFHEASDRVLLRMFLHECAKLPPGERVEAFENLLAGKEGSELDRAIERFLDQLYANTKVTERDERLRMFDLSNEDLVGEGDSFIGLAARLYGENEEKIERRKSFQGSLSVLMPKWIEATAAWSGRELYADANGTMRLNFGEVKGYSPRDAVYYRPFTSLEGVAEKHTGVPPFDCPDRILELAAKKEYGPYDRAGFGSVPVNLLTTNDSTGGNSGSPLLNAKGELVGVLFDGNYEALTSDFLFMPDLTRSISVDVHYILFILGKVDHAQNVLEELGVK